MPDVATCFWFEKDAETAVRLYTSLLPDSRIGHVLRAPGPYPAGDAGDTLLINFTLAGQNYQALNGGSKPEYGNSASIAVSCSEQSDIDRLWSALTADGGSEIACGWLRDRWGVPWQIYPEILPRIMSGSDRDAARRIFAAMQTMVKLDAAALERAASG